MAINYIGGDVLEVTCLHPVLGSFRFEPKANEAFTLDYGGLRTGDEANSITGSGRAIYQMNNTRWGLDGPVATDFNSDNELKNITALAASPVEGVWTMTHVSGAVYKGTGKPVGDVKADSNTAQLTLKIAGSGSLQKI